MSAITPGSEQQAIYIHCVDALVAIARHQRWPTDSHRALAERRKRRWLEQAGGMHSLSERGQQLAQSAAANRLAPDTTADRCHCGQCDTPVPSDSSERVPADHGRELPRAAAS